MSELTQIDGAYQNVAANGDEKDWNADANRWNKGDNDRLYLNDCKFVDYVALDSLIVLTNGSDVDATAEIDGDELTLEIVRDDVGCHKEWTATFALPEDLAEETADEGEDESENEAELVTDGGEGVTEHIDDEDIEGAIERNDDPDHPDALTVEEVRDHLADIQVSFENYWSEHMDALEDGALEVVEDTGDIVVFADHTGHGWSEELDALGVDDVARSVIKSVHHAAADRLTDYSWSSASPLVIRKPDGDGGQRYVEAVVNSLINEGLSPGQAWAVYGVHVAGHSRNSWASMCGYSDHSAVSEPLRKVNEKTPYVALVN